MGRELGTAFVSIFPPARSRSWRQAAISHRPCLHASAMESWKGLSPNGLSGGQARAGRSAVYRLESASFPPWGLGAAIASGKWAHPAANRRFLGRHRAATGRFRHCRLARPCCRCVNRTGIPNLYRRRRFLLSRPGLERRGRSAGFVLWPRVAPIWAQPLALPIIAPDTPQKQERPCKIDAIRKQIHGAVAPTPEELLADLGAEQGAISKLGCCCSSGLSKAQGEKG